MVKSGEAGCFRFLGTAETFEDFGLGGEGGEVGLPNKGGGGGDFGPAQGLGEVGVCIEAELDRLEVGGPVEARGRFWRGRPR